MTEQTITLHLHGFCTSVRCWEWTEHRASFYLLSLEEGRPGPGVALTWGLQEGVTQPEPLEEIWHVSDMG